MEPEKFPGWFLDGFWICVTARITNEVIIIKLLIANKFQEKKENSLNNHNLKKKKGIYKRKMMEKEKLLCFRKNSIN